MAVLYDKTARFTNQGDYQGACTISQYINFKAAPVIFSIGKSKTFFEIIYPTTKSQGINHRITAVNQLSET